MTTVIEEKETTEQEEPTTGRKLTLNDRCDTKACGAAAYVNVKGVSGNLFFCAHHYNEIENNSESNKKITAFAFEVIDERYALLGEDRVKEDS